MAEKNSDNTAVIGDAVTIDTKGCYIRSDGPLIATVGLEDLIIVATADAILVAPKNRDQDVKKLVDQLKSAGHSAAIQTPRVHRPWGFYQSLHTGERFQVKRITVAPGEKLSLQKHYHRAEHWVVVNGTALVTRDEEQILLRENESVYLPLGCVHRLENPGRVPLNLIEVQSGAYLGEDDIVRIEDIYARDSNDGFDREPLHPRRAATNRGQ
jgi:mannose-1-phosphate guanylyltransferase/mannose-1-phosphate guanylyltransferase/mannose-6-phosphate isomerase